MTSYKTSDQIVINADDITVPTSTQKYDLGKKIRISTDTGEQKEYIYVKAHTTLTAYVPYIYAHNGTNVVTKAPVTGSSLVVVPQVAFTADYYGFVLIKGDGYCAIGAETYTTGDALQVLTTGVIAVVDGTTGDKNRLSTTFAMSKAAGTAAANIAVHLFGDVCAIAGS